MACQVPEHQCRCNITSAPGNYSGGVALVTHVEFVGENHATCELRESVVHWWKLECRSGIEYSGASALIIMIIVCVLLLAFFVILVHQLNKAKERLRAAGSTS